MDSVFMFDPLLEPPPNEITQDDESDDDYDFIPVSYYFDFMLIVLIC